MNDAEKQAKAIRDAANILLGVVSDIQLQITVGHLDAIVKTMNRLLIAMGDSHRYEVKGNGIETVGETP